MYNFNIIPPRLIKNYTDSQCTFYFRNVRAPNPDNAVCKDLWNQIDKLWQGLNWYDLFRKTYPQASIPFNAESMEAAMNEMGRVKSVNVNGQEKTYKSGFTFQEYIGWLGEMPLFAAAQPLLGTFLSDYINRPDVRRSLNIPDSVQGWSMCSDEVSNKYRLQLEASLWIYKIMLQYNYKILFFSGDTDGAVPTQGTRGWIESLNLPVKNKWKSWNIDSQVAGYLVGYQGDVGTLDFATVHGAGHMAPQWKRKEVTTLFTNWIHGEPLN